MPVSRGPIKYLFLDRDGVINRRLPGAYVRWPEEFELLPGVPEAISQFRKWFDRIVVVTNQQGIGKGLMTEKDLQLVHRHLKNKLEKAEAWLDQIYYCPHLATAGCKCRKPRPGMAEQAKTEFPEISYSNSLMVGDSPSDMEFGKNLGMSVALISSRVEKNSTPPFPPDYHFPSLAALAQYWGQSNTTSVHP